MIKKQRPFAVISKMERYLVILIVTFVLLVNTTMPAQASSNEDIIENPENVSTEIDLEVNEEIQNINEAIIKQSEDSEVITGNDKAPYGEPISVDEDVEEDAEPEVITPVEEVDEISESQNVGASKVTSGTWGSEGADVRWDFKNGVLTISGTGDMKRGTNPEWKELGAAIKEVVVAEGVTRIGWNNFMSLYGLEKVTIAGSVKRIEEFAFANDKAITEINLGEGIEVIGVNAFYYTGVETLKLPASLKKLDFNSLNGLYSLKEYQIGDGESVYQIEDGVLYTDDYRTLVSFPEARTGSFTVPEGVTTINDAAFIYSKLQEVIMPDTVTKLIGSVFWYADVENVVLSAGLERLPDSVFFHNDKLKTVTIKEGVKSIESTAFLGCESLKSITIPSSVNYICSDAFGSQTELVFAGKELYKTDLGTYVDPVYINVSGEDNYTYAFKVLDLVNSERAANGLPALKMEKSLLDTAMLRASELGIDYSHRRPVDESCFGANKLMTAENISIGYRTPESTMADWMASTGHKNNILNKDNKSIGIGCVKIDGIYCWTQCFSSSDGEETKKEQYKDGNSSRMIPVRKVEKYLSPNIEITPEAIIKGKTSQVYLIFQSYVRLQSTGAVLESSNPKVCSVEGDSLKGNKTGKVEITVYFPGCENWKKSVSVKVVVPVTGVTLKKESVSLKQGASEKLEAVITPSDASDKTLLWSSGDSNIATVDENGMVKAVSKGSTKITVRSKDGNYFARCLVHVIIPVQSIQFKFNSLILRENEPYFISPEITPSNATNTNVILDSSEKMTVYTYLDGVISGAKPGKSIITAITEDGGKTASFTAMVEFYDVCDPSAYYYDSVYWAFERDITSGYGEGTFQPNAPLSRAQTVTFLYKMAGSPEVDGLKAQEFKDVPKNAWYYNAVKWAVANNITSGYGEGTFQPNAVCNRAMIVTFLMHYSKMNKTYVSPSGSSSFKDVSLEDWYKESVDWAVASGVTSGYGEGTFQPGANCNRAMMVTFLKKMAELSSTS